MKIIDDGCSTVDQAPLDLLEDTRVAPICRSVVRDIDLQPDCCDGRSVAARPNFDDSELSS
jgi:hypothetical protein